MSNERFKIAEFAQRYGIQLIYAFGSRALEVYSRINGKEFEVDFPDSDLDLGFKSRKSLTVEEKVNLSIFFEDLFDISKVDVVSLPEVPVFLALEIVQGELLYAEDEEFEAEYQLYIMRLAAELFYFQRQREALVLGE